MSRLVHLLREWQGLSDAGAFPIAAVGFDGLLVVAPKFALVELQGLLLGAFRGVGHVALVRFLHAIDGTDAATADEDFAEEAATLLVFQTVNGEDFPAIDIGQAEDGLDVVETLAELALVEQHHHVGVVDDGLLDDGAADDVLYLLCHHADTGPEFTGGLVEVLDVLCHHGRGDGLPCLLDDQALAVLLDAHLLDEGVHDDERHQREQQRVVLDAVYLEDDEGLVEESGVQGLVQGALVIAATVEVLHQVVVGRQVDAVQPVLVADFGDAPGAELVEGVEAQFLNGVLLEITVVVFGDDLLDEPVLRLGNLALRAFPDEHDEVLQEAYLLDVQFLAADAEGVHGDGVLLGVADVLAADVFAKALVGVTRIDHHDVGVLLPQLAHDAVHVERLAASRRAEHEEVGVVGNLVPALLAADVDSHGHALAVGVVYLQWRVLAVLDVLLVHETGGSIAEGEETVVVGTHAVAVAGEGVDEQLQLVVGPLADVDAQTAKGVLDVVGAFLNVGIHRGADDEVVVGIDQLLVLAGDDVLHLLDVLHGNLVAGIGHGGMAVFLLVERRQLALLVGHEEHLVVDDGVGTGDGVHEADEIDGHGGVVDLDVREGTDDGGEVDAIDIDQAIDLAASVAHADALVIDVEIGHRDGLGGEVHGEVAVNIPAGFLLAEERRGLSGILQLVLHLADFHEEVAPLLAVEGQQLALLGLLGDDEIGHAVGVGASREVAEIGLAEKLVLVARLVAELTVHEHVLLVEGIAFAEGLCEGGHQTGELVVAVGVGRELLHGVFHAEHGGILARLGVEHAHAVAVLHGEVDVLDDTLALAARAEGIDGDCHAGEDGREGEYDV